jgi:hypothetical protein
MRNKAEYLNNNHDSDIQTNIVPVVNITSIDLEQNQQTVQPEEAEAVQLKNKFSFFSTAMGSSLGYAATFSIGAAIRHHPIHKGAITALAGGAIVGAIIGTIGGALDIKEKGNSFNLALCSTLLEWTVFLSSLPMGTQVVPFEQNLSISTLIEDHIIGAAICVSPAIAAIMLLLSCSLVCYATQSFEERRAIRSGVWESFRQYSSTVELAHAIAEAAIIEVPTTVVDQNEVTQESNVIEATRLSI